MQASYNDLCVHKSTTSVLRVLALKQHVDRMLASYNELCVYRSTTSVLRVCET